MLRLQLIHNLHIFFDTRYCSQNLFQKSFLFQLFHLNITLQWIYYIKFFSYLRIVAVIDNS